MGIKPSLHKLTRLSNACNTIDNKTTRSSMCIFVDSGINQASDNERFIIFVFGTH